MLANGTWAKLKNQSVPKKKKSLTKMVSFIWSSFYMYDVCSIANIFDQIVLKR